MLVTIIFLPTLPFLFFRNWYQSVLTLRDSIKSYILKVTYTCDVDRWRGWVKWTSDLDMCHGRGDMDN